MYDDKPLNKDLTLIDVAYIYAWRRVIIIILIFLIKKFIFNLKKKLISKDSSNAFILSNK